jgi:hypothetical protein
MSQLQTITLGGGCFWCLEAVYELVDGVIAVESGYSNGHVLNPSYEQVCGGDTGHVEVVKVTYDADRISMSAPNTAAASMSRRPSRSALRVMCWRRRTPNTRAVW